VDVHGKIVVGVDGSDGALAALRFAVEEARRRGAVLRVVSACELPSYWAWPSGPPITITRQAVTDDAVGAVQTVVDQVLAGDPAPPKVEVLAVAGPAGKVLVDAAREADLLIVGHRGRGGFSSTVLGSVGLSCVLHAPCAVTVVRESPE
jgi:nucleotide-binding universal stress UspA family protein